MCEGGGGGGGGRVWCWERVVNSICVYCGALRVRKQARSVRYTLVHHVPHLGRTTDSGSNGGCRAVSGYSSHSQQM